MTVIYHLRKETVWPCVYGTTIIQKISAETRWMPCVFRAPDEVIKKTFAYGTQLRLSASLFAPGTSGIRAARLDPFKKISKYGSYFLSLLLVFIMYVLSSNNRDMINRTRRKNKLGENVLVSVVFVNQNVVFLLAGSRNIHPFRCLEPISLHYSYWQFLHVYARFFIFINRAFSHISSFLCTGLLFELGVS